MAVRSVVPLLGAPQMMKSLSLGSGIGRGNSSGSSSKLSKNLVHLRPRGWNWITADLMRIASSNLTSRAPEEMVDHGMEPADNQAKPIQRGVGSHADAGNAKGVRDGNFSDTMVE